MNRRPFLYVLGLAAAGFVAWSEFGGEDNPIPLRPATQARLKIASTDRGTVSDSPTLQMGGTTEREPLLAASDDPFAIVNFAVQAAPPAPPPPVAVQAPPPPPPAPVAPPFPFRYVGRMTGVDGQSGVYLASERELFSVNIGSVVEGGFKIEEISDTQIVVRYLPLDERSTISRPITEK